jgi:DNA-binding NarL/FixJ family response regulator
MKTPVRIIIADDHALFRQGLISMLALHPHIEIAAELERADDLMPALARTPCDVLLLDLQMERNTLCDIEALVAKVAVIVVTATERVDDAVAAVRAGARAIVFKRYAIETLLTALNAVTKGEVWMPPSLQADVVARLREPASAALTARERDIVRHVARGLRNAEVARCLDITEVTVKTHVNNVFQKLGLRDRVELALYAVRVGLIGAHEREP